MSLLGMRPHGAAHSGASVPNLKQQTRGAAMNLADRLPHQVLSLPLELPMAMYCLATMQVLSISSWKTDSKIGNRFKKIQGKDTTGGHYFGDAVAMSGETIVVGTSVWKNGAVYVFARGADGLWTQQDRLIGSAPFGSDKFGASLAIYQNTLVVGAPEDDESLDNSGAAYIFTNNGTSWHLHRKVGAADRTEGHRFGISVSISDYTLAVSSEGFRDGAGNFGGNVYVFAQTGSNWTQQMKVSGTDISHGDRFGSSISVSSNYLAAGSPRQSTLGAASGAAYLHKCVTTTTTTTRSYDLKESNGQTAAVDAWNQTKAVTSFAAETNFLPSSVVLLAVLAIGH